MQCWLAALPEPAEDPDDEDGERATDREVALLRLAQFVNDAQTYLDSLLRKQ